MFEMCGMALVMWFISVCLALSDISRSLSMYGKYGVIRMISVFICNDYMVSCCAVAPWRTSMMSGGRRELHLVVFVLDSIFMESIISSRFSSA